MTYISKRMRAMKGKLFVKIPLLTMGIVAAGMLGSCSNEPGFDGATASGTMLVKSPEMAAYSGGNLLGKSKNVNTRSADVNGNQWGETWDCIDNVYPGLTAEDLAEIKRLLSPGQPVENEIIIPWENYWVQQVYKGESSYYASDKDGNATGTQVTGSNQMDKLVARNQHQEYAWTEENNWQGGWVTVEYEHISNFDNGDNHSSYGSCPCGINHEGTTLMTEMSLDGVTPNNQFGYHETWGNRNKDRNNYIIIEYKGDYYVGFDYQAETDRQNPGEASRVDRDWCFTDWIVKITPAYHKGLTPENPGVGGGETEGDFCDECGHEAHEGSNCESCEEGSSCNPSTGAENPGVGDDDNVDKKYDEVEINLAMDSKNGEYLESHLSIHVRTATDVEVFIPVPVQYYCEADDMAIVLEHADMFVHGGPARTEFVVGYNVVSLNVEFVDGGIRVWTEGVTQEVIDYCWETYHDGITFEVWNYFNDPDKLAAMGFDMLTIEELKGYLDQATVKFLDKIPGEYINSFGKDNGKYDPADNPDGKDFHVTPESQKDSFADPVEGSHLNDSDNNDIYVSL